MKKLLFLTLITATILSCGKEENERKRAGKAVKTITLLEREIKNEIVENSTAKPIDEVIERTETGGELKAIYYKNGDVVEKGTVILELENNDVAAMYSRSKVDLANQKSQYEKALKFSKLESQNSYERAKSQYIQVQQNLNSAKKALEEKEINYLRNTELYEEGYISEMEYLSLQSGYQSVKSNYDSLSTGTIQEAKQNLDLEQYKLDQQDWNYTINQSKAIYEAAQSEYAMNEEDYSDLLPTAKISGIVSGLDLEISYDIPAGTELYSIINLDKIKLETTVSGKDISSIGIGDKVYAYFNDLDKTFEGTIYEIDPRPNDVTKRYPIKIEIENKNHEIKSGMYAKISILGQGTVGLVVPKEAIVIKGLGEYVAVVRDGKAKVIAVKTGLSNEEDVQVISDELMSGDKLIISGQYLVEDGDAVQEVE